MWTLDCGDLLYLTSAFLRRALLIPGEFPRDGIRRRVPGAGRGVAGSKGTRAGCRWASRLRFSRMCPGPFQACVRVLLKDLSGSSKSPEAKANAPSLQGPSHKAPLKGKPEGALQMAFPFSTCALGKSRGPLSVACAGCGPRKRPLFGLQGSPSQDPPRKGHSRRASKQMQRPLPCEALRTAPVRVPVRVPVRGKSKGPNGESFTRRVRGRRRRRCAGRSALRQEPIRPLKGFDLGSRQRRLGLFHAPSRRPVALRRRRGRGAREAGGVHATGAEPNGLGLYARTRQDPRRRLETRNDSWGPPQTPKPPNAQNPKRPEAHRRPVAAPALDGAGAREAARRGGSRGAGVFPSEPCRALQRPCRALQRPFDGPETAMSCQRLLQRTPKRLGAGPSTAPQRRPFEKAPLAVPTPTAPKTAVCGPNSKRDGLVWTLRRTCSVTRERTYQDRGPHHCETHPIRSFSSK
ncbi:hypothetical protein M885DRAFT_195787 [Pelagophyceae sp. CCMP2097]|nr:hypothetical protein M885DRAFT_195787 [Pelagophyceae sp. CCMP2097]